MTEFMENEMTASLVKLCGATVRGLQPIYVLPDSIRVPCRPKGEPWGYPQQKSHGDWCSCEGRGWVPTNDVWVLFNALYNVRYGESRDQERVRIALGNSVFFGQETFLREALKEIGALPGVELGE